MRGIDGRYAACFANGPNVSMGTANEGILLSPAQARKFAIKLLKAADKADQQTAVGAA